MKRTEFETKLVSLEAQFSNEKVKLENIINEIYDEMDIHEKALVERKGRVRNLRNNIEQLRTKWLENKAKLFVEFEESKENDETDPKNI